MKTPDRKVRKHVVPSKTQTNNTKKTSSPALPSNGTSLSCNRLLSSIPMSNSWFWKSEPAVQEPEWWKGAKDIKNPINVSHITPALMLPLHDLWWATTTEIHDRPTLRSVQSANTDTSDRVSLHRVVLSQNGCLKYHISDPCQPRAKDSIRPEVGSPCSKNPPSPLTCRGKNANINITFYRPVRVTYHLTARGMADDPGEGEGMCVRVCM